MRWSVLALMLAAGCSGGDGASGIDAAPGADVPSGVDVASTDDAETIDVTPIVNAPESIDTIAPIDGPAPIDVVAPVDGPAPIDVIAPIDAVPAPDAGPPDASLLCGNGTTNPGEVCDDGNTADGDGCSHDCHSLEVCGDDYLNPGEVCDDGGETATCDVDCTLAVCGDAHLNLAAGEFCDFGGDSASCDFDCTAAFCGDSHANAPAGEACDDGAVNTATCDSNCTLPVCGDAFVNTAAGESCDAGTETAFCDIDCTFRTCGDGHVNMAASEACDDHNNNACGTCTMGCSTAITLVAATGTITNVTAAQLVDGETFTLNDGINPPVVFEFDPLADGVAAGNVVVVTPAGLGAGMMADQMTTAINGVGSTLRITSSHSSGPNATLVHDLAGSFGNHPTTETVTDTAFVTSGMGGGLGGNCAAGVGCMLDIDCHPSLACVGHVCM